MAQSTAPPKAVTLRNFSRRPRVPSVPPQQRMHGIDGVWMACFGVVSLLVALATGGTAVLGMPQTYLAALTVVFLYVLGFRVRDRAAAVVAAALLSTSPLYAATQIDSVRSSLFVLFTVLALAAYATAPYAAAAELLAVIMAAGATIMRPEGLLLGAVLVGFAIVDKRPGGIVGFAIYLVLTFTGMGAMLVSTHQHFPFPVIRFDPRPILSLIDKQTVILSCFVIALLGDLAEPTRRKRLKPVLLWAGLFLVFETFFQFSGFSFEASPFRPILYLLAAGGVARILPVVAGEFAAPAMRYGVAVLFVGILVAARASSEWTSARAIVYRSIERAAEIARTKKITAVAPKPTVTIAVPPVKSRISMAPAAHPAPAPSTKPVAAVPKPAPAAKPTPAPTAVASTSNVGIVPPGTVHHYVKVPKGALKPVPGVPAALVAAAVAAGVPTYASHNGQEIPRTPWAIKWDLDHKPKPAAKPAATVAAKPAPKPIAAVKPVAAVKPPPAKPKPIVVAKAPVKPVVRVAPKPKPKLLPQVVAKPKPIVHSAPANSLEAQAAAAGVPMYHIVRGRKVMRNEWAVRWDIAHKPKSVATAKPAAKPVAIARPAVAMHPSTPHPVVHVAPKPKPVAKPHVAIAKPKAVWHPTRRPAARRWAKPIAHRWLKPSARRWAPKRAVHARHRSIWAVRWQRAHRHH